ncbi:MAG: rane fusion protein multidrug efflux system [Anaerophaga sp.]|nr:rane fusion protein multidrug efflux system [Anaerophaga sp.]
MNSMNYFLKIMIVGVLGLFMVNCASSDDNSREETPNISTVKTTRLGISKISRKIELSTTLEGYETVNIAPSINGTIERIFVDVGVIVKKGDLLVRMDQQQYNNAKLTYTNAKKDYERLKILNETGTVSQQQFDQAKLAYDQAKENLEFLEPNTFVRAPFNGVITAKNYEAGELFTGSPILTITKNYVLKALISVPESYVPYVKEGTKLDVKSEVYPGKTFPAAVEIVYPMVDPDTHTFQLKIRISNPDLELRPGMYVNTSMNLNEVEALMVPYQAVLKLTGANNRFVFVNDNGVAKRVSVVLGQRHDDMVEIKSGNLKSGDELVTTGQAKLVDGAKLKVVE